MAVYPVIMCGGSGTRLWPESTPTRPKQFLPLVGDRTMFQDTVLRVAGLAEGGQVVVVAGVAHADLITRQLEDIGVEAAVLLEPEPRDSAPAMAAACAWIEARDAAGVAVVVAADHHIPDGEAFRSAARVAVQGAQAGRIVTLGVSPTAPSTAYGYISPGTELGPVRAVAAFVEKPDAATAQRHIADGYLWNSGNFVVAAGVLMAELDRFAPAIAAAARQAVSAAPLAGCGRSAAELTHAFRSAPKISIDYAVMEKTDRAAVLPVSFAWSDLGAWDAVWAAGAQDAAGNVVSGEGLLVDVEGSLVRAGDGMDVAVIGLSNVAVVADRGRVLVSSLGATQKVKAAAEQFGGRAMNAKAPFATVEEAAVWFDTWLRTSALPLWWTVGADHVAGGFREALTPDGRPVSAPRRSRVQTRQTYVYATAGMMGWEGPWRQAAWHGMDYFFSRYRRPDGLFRALVSEAGEPLDETAALYDQAFALLAMATLHQADPGHAALAGEAQRLLQALQSLRHGAGGFREAEPHPFQANAHMHLLEAAMAWMEAGGGLEWEALAAEIVALALARFIDAEGGFLREFFDESWSPAPSDDGRRVEPGHQFEWAWLLERWARRTGDGRCAKAARSLYAAGARGVDGARGVAINALDDSFQIVDPQARLWPQTEWLKAACLLDDRPGIVQAAAALRGYLIAPSAGAWRDGVDRSAEIVSQPAPASSFYHIVAACRELQVCSVRALKPI